MLFCFSQLAYSALLEKSKTPRSLRFQGGSCSDCISYGLNYCSSGYCCNNGTADESGASVCTASTSNTCSYNYAQPYEFCDALHGQNKIPTFQCGTILTVPDTSTTYSYSVAIGHTMCLQSLILTKSYVNIQVTSSTNMTLYLVSGLSSSDTSVKTQRFIGCGGNPSSPYSIAVSGLVKLGVSCYGD